MQLFPCPFCGPRSEAEFHFGGDVGNARPQGEAVTDDAWASYLHVRNNVRGPAAEIWMHLTCGEFFRLDRDTVTHEVQSAQALPQGGHP